MADNVEPRRIRFRAADGRSLGGTWWGGDAAAERTILFLCGIACPQRYFRWLAGYLAGRGFGVLTFDYRGVAESRDPFSDDPSVTLDDWINLDLPAALAEARRLSGARFLAVVAHSIGGQLLGQSPIRKEIDATLLIASQRSIPGLFRGLAKLRLWVGYVLFPPLARVLGYLPSCRLWFPERCPGQTFEQLGRWSRHRLYTDDGGESVEERFAEYQGPLAAIGFSDDRYYAPPAAVRALVDLYQRANVLHETIEPESYGVSSLGHSGFFHKNAPRALWERVVDHLRDFETEHATASR